MVRCSSVVLVKHLSNPISVSSLIAVSESDSGTPFVAKSLFSIRGESEGFARHFGLLRETCVSFLLKVKSVSNNDPVLRFGAANFNPSSVSIVLKSLRSSEGKFEEFDICLGETRFFLVSFFSSG